MHTRVGVIVKPHKSDEKTIEAAQELLLKYNSNLEVMPYREYPDKSYVQQLLKNYKVDSLEALTASGADWKNGEEGGIDKQGLYFISTHNPDGAYDSWYLLHEPVLVTSDIFSEEKYGCGDIITPDGVLHRGPISYIVHANWFNKRQKERALARRNAAWEHKLRGFADTYNKMSLVIFDCHS